MTLRLYNTLTRTKEEFTPLDPKNVRMYVCGPTVYDFAHIGNARPVIVFDVLFRLLRQIYGADHVTYVRNITDVDDKINARAREEGVSIRERDRSAPRSSSMTTSPRWACLPPTRRAARHRAHRRDDRDDRAADRHGPCLCGGRPCAVRCAVDEGLRPALAPLARRDAGRRPRRCRALQARRLDFVLWKPSDDETPGWDSPWGRGRPGWHIECSAMSWKHLGEVFDIHGGGIDLIFPHHENEIAQTRCAFGHDVMANVWMHNGFLQVEGQKMSKSLGNFLTINELLTDWPGDVLRFNMLRTHYRQPIDWTLEEPRGELAHPRRLLQQCWRRSMPKPDRSAAPCSRR